MEASLTPDGILWIPVEEDVKDEEIKCIILCTSRWSKSYVPKSKIIVPEGICNKPKIIGGN